MICPDCRDGGTFNAEAERLTNPKLAEVMRDQARKAHARCNNRCDCHHVVGDGFINRQLVSEVRNA